MTRPSIPDALSGDGYSGIAFPIAVTDVSTSEASYARLPVLPVSLLAGDVVALEFECRESSEVTGASGMSIDGIDVGTSTAIWARVIGTVDDACGVLSARAGADGVNGGAGVIQ